MTSWTRSAWLAVGWLGLWLHLPAADGLERCVWRIEGVEREALVHRPAAPGPGGAPLVFVFHGHGGTMAHAARTFAIHELWPEAVVVYPQGLPTPSALVDAEGKQFGWQGVAGGQGDRDLKFFDEMLAGLRREGRVDDRRVYVMGHSNGGLFTYLLWAERGGAFAAVAPSAAVLTRGARKLSPKPALIVASPRDTLVKYVWQERMLDFVLKENGCGARDPAAAGYKVYPSSRGAEVAVYLHDEGHRYPAKASGLIVAFFKARTGR